MVMTENVHDYPRPPRVEPTAKRIRIVHGGTVVADSTRAQRVLETTQPPAYYLPLEEIADGALEPSGGPTTFCEWKGDATYYDVLGVERAAWTYLDPTPGFESIRGWVAFYPGRLDECSVDGERVRPQENTYYGGWITNDIEGI
jgi:uncharacterized protein (DUF427 family)